MRDNLGTRIKGAAYAPAVDAETAMKIFDELPPVIRRSMARAPVPVAASWAMNLIVAGYEPDDIAEAIDRKCAQVVAAAYQERGFDG